MSEIQRYSLKMYGSEKKYLGLFQQSPDGELCAYTDLLWYKRQYWMSVAMLVVACAVFSTVLVYEKSSHGPVVMPMGAGEKASLLMGMQDMQADKERAERQRDDLLKLNLNYKAQIKALNAKEDGHIVQLEALQARGHEIDKLNREQAQRMSTHQGLVLEAKRVLGVEHVQIVER